MQVKELKSEGLNYELEITVDAKDIDKHVDERLQEYGKTVKMPGFRPGKVPLDILKQRYGKAVLGEVLEKAVNDSSSQALQEKGLRPALQPKIEVKEFDEGKDLIYKIEIEVLPEFKVMDLKKVKLEKPIAKVEESAIDDALGRIAKQSRQSEVITEDRGAKEGDIVVIDFHGRTKKDGQEHPGMHAHGHHLELGSGQFIPGFEDQLIGAKSGDKVTVGVTFPEEYHSNELAGQEAEFDVDISEIREPIEAEINDDFAKSLGFDNEGALRDAVKTQIENEYASFSRAKLKRALLDVLDDEHEFPVPEGMLELEFSNIKQQLILENQQNIKDGEMNLSNDEEEELQAISERRVRLGMILSEIGGQNNIMVSDQELQRAVITEAQRFPGQEAEIFEYYRKTPDALEALRAPVFEDKVVDFILELAEVNDKEVSVDDLTAEDDDSYLEYKKSKKSDSKGTKSKSKSTKTEKKSTKKSTTKSKSTSSSKKTTKSKAGEEKKSKSSGKKKSA
jgi:trigger factor